MKKTSHIKTKVSNVVKSIQGRTKRLAATTIAGLPAEAIPFIGTAAIVGSAAYEINAACDTMIDLHELDVVFNPDNEFDSSVCGMEVPSTEQLRESWSRYYGEIGKAFYKWMNE